MAKKWFHDHDIHSIHEWDLETCLSCLMIEERTIRKHINKRKQQQQHLTPDKVRQQLVSRICVLLGYFPFTIPIQSQSDVPHLTIMLLQHLLASNNGAKSDDNSNGHINRNVNINMGDHNKSTRSLS